MIDINTSKRILTLAAEMSEHYYGEPLVICYSGGKDSDVILRLAMETLKPNQFEVLHAVTTVDSPVTNKYVNDIYKELAEKGIKATKAIPKGSDGKPTNMWKLIVEKQMPPTRLARYCCQVLKEVSTPNRIAILGGRSDESSGRKGRDVFGIRGGTKKDAKFYSLDHAEEVHKEALEKEKEPGGEIWDCTLIKTMRDKKDAVVNPIYDWTDADVWSYLRSGHYPYNPMYDMGYHRVGCIGCPMATYRQKKKEFAGFPYFKQKYIEAFDACLKQRIADGRPNKENWTSGKDIYDWWVEEYKHNPRGQMTIMDYMGQTDDMGLIVRKKEGK